MNDKIQYSEMWTLLWKRPYGKLKYKLLAQRKYLQHIYQRKHEKMFNLIGNQKIELLFIPMKLCKGSEQASPVCVILAYRLVWFQGNWDPLGPRKTAISPYTTWNWNGKIIIQFSSVTQSCPTLWDPMNRNMPGLPVHHQLLESTQTHVHWVGDAIQLSHPLLSPSPPALDLSQHQGLFKWISSSHQVAKVKIIITREKFYLNGPICRAGQTSHHPASVLLIVCG